MIPKPPPREGQLGFLYVPPFRVQGVSVAGEATAVQVPELDVCFDMGSCPRAMLASPYVAISHGHMDHVGGLAYYCSQRQFQGMGTGKIVCDARIEPAIDRMMKGYVDLERQKTPYEIIPLNEGEQIEIKNNTLLRTFRTEHTCPSMGYTLLERRTKLKEEFHNLPQEKLCELKDRGTEITRTLEIPLVTYTGDTAPGAHLVSESVRTSRFIITECTFFEPDHRQRAKIGMHLHVEDLVEWLRVCTCEAMIVTHVSRRTNLAYARKRLEEVAGDLAERVLFLMDFKTNRARYDAQVEQAHA
ncbi:MAG: hypothetical protein KDA28_04195 [Phycisphaerales bacterium]|nr:hypothetical protein [Phycisphaerales bacterium]